MYQTENMTSCFHYFPEHRAAPGNRKAGQDSQILSLMNMGVCRCHMKSPGTNLSVILPDFFIKL
ncbi:MAG: hypothetical protein B6245_01435 [Desulfobacteraceae bacterium 4572_88]|nr:MAG: hypothetical protein B6245_01435 [Desulfobacteraceae bacterium 4572_88]